MSKSIKQKGHPLMNERMAETAGAMAFQMMQ